MYLFARSKNLQLRVSAFEILFMKIVSSVLPHTNILPVAIFLVAFYHSFPSLYDPSCYWVLAVVVYLMFSWLVDVFPRISLGFVLWTSVVEDPLSAQLLFTLLFCSVGYQVYVLILLSHGEGCSWAPRSFPQFTPFAQRVTLIVSNWCIRRLCVQYWPRPMTCLSLDKTSPIFCICRFLPCYVNSLFSWLWQSTLLHLVSNTGQNSTFSSSWFMVLMSRYLFQRQYCCFCKLSDALLCSGVLLFADFSDYGYYIVERQYTVRSLMLIKSGSTWHCIWSVYFLTHAFQ